MTSGYCRKEWKKTTTLTMYSVVRSWSPEKTLYTHTTIAELLIVRNLEYYKQRAMVEGGCVSSVVCTNLRKKDKACDSLVWETLGLHIWAHNINLHIFDVVLIIVLFYKYWCPIFCSQRWMIRMGALLFIYIPVYIYYRILCMNKFNLAPWSKLDYWVGKL